MKQPGLVNSALIFNTTYNWYSLHRKFNHAAPSPAWNWIDREMTENKAQILMFSKKRNLHLCALSLI